MTGFVAVSSAGFVCFLLLPVHGPRPAAMVTDFMFRVLQSNDRPLNCFPSLHIGLAVYTVLFAGRILERDSTTRRVVVSLGWLWTTLIAYAALATKRHSRTIFRRRTPGICRSLVRLAQHAKEHASC